MPAPSMYAKVTTVILSAAAVVAATFGLFNSMLTDLMPQVEGARLAVNFVSFGTMIVLLALTLVIRKKLSGTSQYVWAGVGVLCLGIAVFTFFSFGDLVRKYVYQYPPAVAPGIEQRPLVSGPLHELGKKRVGDMDVATAVSKYGGPEMVNGRQLLWSAASRSQVVGWFVRYYAAIAFLITTALFVEAIAVWRTLSSGAGPRAGKRPVGKKAAAAGKGVAGG